MKKCIKLEKFYRILRLSKSKIYNSDVSTSEILIVAKTPRMSDQQPFFNDKDFSKASSSCIIQFRGVFFWELGRVFWKYTPICPEPEKLNLGSQILQDHIVLLHQSFQTSSK